jgi:DNA-binding response OmpR family regulator
MAKILLIEPDAVLAKLYLEAFKSAGHEARLTVSAQDAVFKVDEDLPDVVVVELQLVAHSGIEFLYELRSYAEWQNIPVIVHICIPPAEFMDSMELLRGQLGVTEYLYKPQTTLRKLLRSIREAVEPAMVVGKLAARAHSGAVLTSSEDI